MFAMFWPITDLREVDTMERMQEARADFLLSSGSCFGFAPLRIAGECR